MSGKQIEFGIRITADGRVAVVETEKVKQSVASVGPAAATAGNQAAASLDKVGMSARQTAAALRQVPMQFTDIATSLAAGQSPMQVFLQQGGQLKDTFGGAVPAVRALGGYVAGLVNPFTVAAAAAAGLAVAYEAGRSESEAMARSVIMTGNAIGATVGQVQALSRSAAAASGASKAAAAEAMTQLVATGKVAAGSLDMAAAAALRLARAGGPAVDETVKQFAELGKSPVEASRKLNEQANYLTASVYRQIKALHDQGDASGAAALAQKAWADAIEERTPKLEANLGTLQKSWRNIADTAKFAWDAMLNVGRTTSLEDQLAAAEMAVKNARAGFLGASRVGELEAARDELKTKVAAEQAAAVAAGNVKDQVEKQAKAQAEIDKSATHQIALLRQSLELIKAAPDSVDKARRELEIKKQIEGIERSMGAEGRQTRLAQIDGELKRSEQQWKAWADEVGRLNKQALAGDEEALAARQVAEAQILEAKLAAARARARLAADGPERQKAAEEIAIAEAEVTAQQREAEQERLALAKASADAITAARLDALKRQGKHLEAAGVEFTKGYQDKILKAQLDGNDELLTSYAEVGNAMLMQGAFEEAKARYAELAAEMAEALDAVRVAAERDGGVLAGLAADEQADKIKNNFIPRLREARAEMERMAGESPVNGKAIADAGREIERVANELSPFWKNFWGEMHQGLTTELMSSASQEGRSFGESFVTGVKAYFKTAGLKLGVQLVGDLAIGGVKSALGFGGGASNGINMLSAGSSAYNAFSGGGVVGGLMSGYGAGVAGVEAGLSASFIAEGAAGASGFGATAGATMAETFGATFATAAPYVAAAIVAAEAFGLFGDDDRQRNLVGRGVEGTVSRGGLDGSLVSLWGTAPNDYWGGSTFDAIPDTALRTINAQIAAVFAAAEAGAAALGVTATALGDVTYAFGTAGRGIDVEFADALSATSERLARVVIPNIADYQAANESLGQTFARVVGDVTAVKQIFASLGRDFTATGADAAALAERVVGAFGGAGALATSWQSYKQTYYSEEELRAETTAQLTEVFAQLNRTMPTTRAGFRALVAELDLTTAAELQTFRALMNVEQAFASITPAANDFRIYTDAVASAQSDLMVSYRDELNVKTALAGRMTGYVQSLTQLRNSLLTGNLSPLSPGGRYEEARRQLEDISRRKSLGDESAYEALQPAVQAFLEASQAFNASNSQYATDFAWAQSIVEDSRTTADRIASAAQAQAAALQSQISLLDANVRATLSVADAVGALQQSVIAAIGAGASVSAATKNAAGIYTAGGGATYSAANDLWTSADGTQSGSMAAVRATAQGILDTAGPRALYDGWQSVGGSLADLNSIMGAPAGTAEEWARQNGLRAYANGGDHFGGLRMVGERGWEIEATGPARYWSHDQSINMLRAANSGGGGDLAPLLREIVAELRALVRQGGAVAGANGERLSAVVDHLSRTERAIRQAA